MRIDDPKATSIASQGLGRPAGAAGAGRGEGARPSGPGSTGDSFHLSNLASVVRQLAVDTPDRAARVDQLAREVQSGRYTVDAQAVSSAMVGAAFTGF